MVDPLGQLTSQEGSDLPNKKSSRKAAETINYKFAGDFSREGNSGKETS